MQGKLPLSVVSHLEDVFKWPRQNSSVMESDHVSCPRQRVYDTINATRSLTSAFSGIVAETIALNILCADIDREHVSDSLVAHPVHLASVERDAECRLEQSICPNGPVCQFADIMSFCADELLAQLKVEASRPHGYDLDRIAPLILAPGAVKLEAWCSYHKRMCRMPRARMHSSGCPCTDFTSWGKCRRLRGPTVPVYLVWIAMRLALREPVLLFENVSTFPTSLLQMFFGNLYDLHAVELCCTVLGCAVRRPRLFVVMCLRGSCTLTRPMQDIPHLFRRGRSTESTWRAYCVADESELLSELRWGSRQERHR